jgi:predicted MFS family arabinose efflux permease
LLATSGWRAVFLVKVPMAVVVLILVAAFVARDARVSQPARAQGFDILRNSALMRGFSASALVATVLMATLVVGPFHLTRGLGLAIGSVGLVMSVGPAAAALSAAPSGRVVARYGTTRVTIGALCGTLAGTLLFALLPRSAGVFGYVGSLVVLTTSYAAFQTANNTAVMLAAGDAQRGVVSGMLNLSRNAGLIAGSSLMGSIYGVAGFRATFAAAAVLILLALVVATDRSERAMWSASHRSAVPHVQ